MRDCNMCGESKSLESFPKNKSKKDGRGYECRDCVAVARRNKRHEKRNYINSLKTPCVICDEPDPIVLDWHHIDPSTKEMGLNQMDKPLQTLVAETKKCVTLCANCHRRIHAGTVEIPT